MKGLKINGTSKLVKIKVKHILIALATIFVFIPNLIIGISYIIFNMDITVGEKRVPASYFTQGTLNIYVKMPKISPFEDLAYYIMGINYYDYKNNVLVGANYYSAELKKPYSAYNGLESAIKSHERGISNKNKGKYYLKNISALINLYEIKGDEGKSMELVNRLKNSKDKELQSIGFINEAILLTKKQNYDEAVSALESIDENYKKAFNVKRLLGTVSIGKGDENSAINYLSEPYGTSEENIKLRRNLKYWISDISFLNVIYNRGFYDEDNKKRIDTVSKNNIINDEFRGDMKGHFNINGVSMEGALILLVNNRGVYQTNEEIDYRTALVGFSYVNENGEFYLNNIPQGQYYISVIIPYKKAIDTGLYFGNMPMVYFDDNTVEVKSKKNLEEGRNYNEKYIIADSSRLIVSDDPNDQYEYHYNREEGEEDLINIVQKDDLLEVTNMGGNLYERRLFGIDTLKDFKKGQKIELSKNFIMHSYNLAEVFKGEYEIANEENSNDAAVIWEFQDKNVSGDKKIQVHYSEEEKEFINKNNFKGLLLYYEDKYNDGNREINVIERMIKLYVLGYNRLGEGKNVNRALKLNTELREARKNDYLYSQIEEYINKNYIELFGD